MPAKFVIKKASTGSTGSCWLRPTAEPVATSELYESKSNAKRGIEACKRAAAEAEIVDED